jgi:hypothetical protein
MSLSLGEQQRLFGRLVGELLHRIYDEGYEVTIDWAYRPPEVAAYYADLGIGVRSSLHTKKLAIDLNLFKDGVWLRNTEDHRPIGEWWERQHPLCRWGGRFGDGNHYSSERDGVR